MKYYPNFIGGKRSKMRRYFRKNTLVPIGHMDRYPMPNCVFNFPVDVSFGSIKPSESHRLRINESNAIRISASKVKTKQTIERHCPVVTPYEHATAYFSGQSLLLNKLETEIGFPFVAKLKYGFGGKGMWFIYDMNVLQEFIKNTAYSDMPKYFFEKLYKFTDEYRIHISPLLVGRAITYHHEYALKDSATGKWEIKMSEPVTRSNGEILGIKKKLKSGASITSRNLGQGVIFSSKFTRPNEWEEMVKASVLALKLMGLDFGCIDILYNKHTKKFVISETNTNPGMDNIADNPCPNVTAQNYQKAFPHIILSKYLNKCAVSR